MIKLVNWTAKRAGGRITINGVDDATGKPHKVVGVDMIEAGNLHPGLQDNPIATDRYGSKYELA
jgi:hypothetical protein